MYQIEQKGKGTVIYPLPSPPLLSLLYSFFFSGYDLGENFPILFIYYFFFPILFKLTWWSGMGIKGYIDNHTTT